MIRVEISPLEYYMKKRLKFEITPHPDNGNEMSIKVSRGKYWSARRLNIEQMRKNGDDDKTINMVIGTLLETMCDEVQRIEP